MHIYTMAFLGTFAFEGYVYRWLWRVQEYLVLKLMIAT